MDTNLIRGWSKVAGRRKQSGQALIYGLFMLVAGLSALFFLFNVGQLTREKTKLINTSDAVAYSAGIMQARALNFAAYTNRALVADEIAISHMVSLKSWGEFLVEHGQAADTQLGCGYDKPGYGAFSEPNVELMILLPYAGVCYFLGSFNVSGVLAQVNQGINFTAFGAVMAAETSKLALKASQTVMMGAMPFARRSVMQDVADANYSNDGTIKVDEIPLRDTFYGFDGAPIMNYNTGEKRTGMRNMVMKVFDKSGFTQRNWSDTALIPEETCLPLGIYNNHVDRSGGITPPDSVNMNMWQASDQASYTRWRLRTPRFILPYCGSSTDSLGSGSQTADENGSRSDPSSDDWYYSGIPSYADLSESALGNPDPRAQFAVRVLRDNRQTRTSDARADIKITPRLNNYSNAAARDTVTGGNVYVGLSASETFFESQALRPGQKELASLFNPYWQVHLIDVPASVRIAAQALQGAVSP